MDAILVNPFDGNGFDLLSLTAAVNTMPFVPGQAGALNIWDNAGVATTRIAVEEYAGRLTLIPNTPRSAPAPQNTAVKRTLRYFDVPHFPVVDTIQPSEVQNVREFGTGNLVGPDAIVRERFGTMIPSLDATVEYGRIGAIKGVILDSDGTTPIYNLFTEFGLSQTTVNFALGTTTTSLINKMAAVRRAIDAALGQAPYSHIHVFAGKTWWDAFTAHDNLTNTFLYYNQQGLDVTRDDARYRPFVWGGAVWEEYRGSVNGVSFIADNEAYAFPVGVPGLFQTRYAPADYMETVNTVGLPRYAKMAPDPSGMNKYWTLEAQTNAISICTRPASLIKLTNS